MHHHHTHPDPDVARAVETSWTKLRSVASKLLPGRTAKQTPLADDAPEPDFHTQHSLLLQLCEQEDWETALPLAASLFIANAQAPHAAFLLATCLQRLKQNELALSFFGLCAQLQGDEPDPGLFFRMGECHAALGHPDDAQEAFAATIELAHGRHEYAEVLSLAQNKTAALQAIA